MDLILEELLRFSIQLPSWIMDFWLWVKTKSFYAQILPFLFKILE